MAGSPVSTLPKVPPSPIPPSPTFLLRLLFRFPALLYFRRASQGTFSRRPFDATTFFFPLFYFNITHTTHHFCICPLICRTNKPESSNHIAIKTAIMSSMRNAVQRRNHKERAQPLERQKWGLLEKHKVGLTSLLLAA